MIFQTILMLKAILAKFLSQKPGQLEHSYLKYALGTAVNFAENAFRIKR